MRHSVVFATVGMLVLTGMLFGQEEAVKTRAHVRPIATGSGVFVALIRGEKEDARARGFMVRAIDATAKAETSTAVCYLPAEKSQAKAFRMALLPEADKDGLTGCQVVTWIEAAKVTAPAKFEFSKMKEISKETIDTGFAITFKPVWTQDKKLQAFEIMALAAVKPMEPTGEIVKARKGWLEKQTEEKLVKAKPLAYSRIQLALPREMSPDIAYGIILVPKWKENLRTLDGFEATLVSVPRKVNK